MMEMSGDTFKFFVDQVVRQYQELKTDLKVEMTSLRLEINKETQHYDNQLTKLKDEIDVQSGLTDERLVNLERFTWRLSGALVLLVVIMQAAAWSIETLAK